MIKCEDCRYWQHGECHRYAPKPVTPQGVAYGGFARWPLTNPEDWCGEAEPVGTELDEST